MVSGNDGLGRAIARHFQGFHALSGEFAYGIWRQRVLVVFLGDLFNLIRTRSVDTDELFCLAVIFLELLVGYRPVP